MTTKIAISIGKGLGNFIKVDELSGAKTTFKSFLRLLVEIKVDNPLKPDFSFYGDGGDPLWIFLKYECLDMYYSSYGRIGHKSINCMAAPEERTLERYVVSVKVNIFSNLFPSFLPPKKFLPLSPLKYFKPSNFSNCVNFAEWSLFNS